MSVKMRFFACAGLVAAFSSWAADISVAVRQNWPWDSRVFIDATMPSGTNDIEFTASFDYDGEHHELGLAVGNGLSQSTFSVTGGVYRFIWDPSQAGFTGAMTSLDISAATFTAAERAWLVVDVETGDSEYVALGDEPVDADGKPWQDDVYKKSKMVFRRIPAGTFTRGYTDAEKTFIKSLEMGGDSRMLSAAETTLTSDYYITIYQVTRAQISRIKDHSSNYYNSLMPDSGNCGFSAGFVCFQRGSNSVEGINWPLTKFAVTTNSLVGIFRARCRNRFMFDLPTCAQWQHAARPDTQWLWYDTSSYPNGMTGGTVDDDQNTLTNIIARISDGYRRYVAKDGTYSPPLVPGQYLPNPYGLYDLVGSRQEIVLDQWNYVESSPYSAGVDPVGLAEENRNSRMTCNSFSTLGTLSNWSIAFISGLYSDAPKNPNNENCYRYVIHLNPPQSFGGKWTNE